MHPPQGKRGGGVYLGLGSGIRGRPMELPGNSSVASVVDYPVVQVVSARRADLSCRRHYAVVWVLRGRKSQTKTGLGRYSDGGGGVRNTRGAEPVNA